MRYPEDRHLDLFSVAVIKQHEQKQLRKESVNLVRLVYRLQSIITGSQGKKSRKKLRGRNEAKFMEECC